jgi:hypothetical protein
LFWILEQVGWFVVGRVDTHRSEFEDVEVCFMYADSFLLEEYRAGGIELDSDD